MGLFRKKQYHVNEAGNIIEGAEPGYRDIREVQREPRVQAKQERKQERAEWKQKQRQAFKEEFRRARLERIKKQGRMAGGTTIGDRLQNFSSGMSSPRSSKSRGYRIDNNYNPFGSMFDTGSNYRRPSKPKLSSTKYKVIGGKAYPIAGTGKKKKKGKHKSRSGFDSFDLTDNWGLL